jgi:hypothetical protein
MNKTKGSNAMHKFPNESGGSRAPSTGGETKANDSSDLSALFHYPALGSLFETAAAPALADMRARLKRTHQNIERVIRHGSKQEAERATRVALAYKIMFQLLDELEKMQRTSCK